MTLVIAGTFREYADYVIKNKLRLKEVKYISCVADIREFKNDGRNWVTFIGSYQYRTDFKEINFHAQSFPKK